MGRRCFRGGGVPGVGRVPAKSPWREDLEGKRELCRWEKFSWQRPHCGSQPHCDCKGGSWVEVRSEGQVRESFFMGCCKYFGFNWKGSFLPDETRIRE